MGCNKIMQKKFRFDKSTLLKIGKGALIAGTGAVALYLLDAVGTMDFGSTWTPIIAVLVPVLINAIREWTKGE